ncbi:TolC family protein [Novosphingobium sp.]|uniref:TolC family protein n=1 Tax=Novosphingobium sp. TaxID=1874826 RepID=UPI003568450D
MNRPALCALVATLLANPVVAAPSLPDEPLVVAALDNHPSVTGAAQRVEAARAAAHMLARGSQEFTLSGSYMSRDITGERRYDEFDASLTRAIRIPGKAGLDRKSGQLGIEVAQNLMEDARHQTALVLSGMWIDWLTAGELQRSDLATVDLLEQEVLALSRRHELRDASRLEIDQTQAALDQARGQATRTLADLERARAMLSANFPDLPLTPEPPALGTPELPREGLEALRALVISRSHEILASQREAERVSTLAERAQRDRLADPSVGVRVFRERGGLERGGGLTFSMPLGGSYRKAAAEQASSEASAAQFELVSTRRMVEATAQSDLLDARNRLASWEKFDAGARTATTAAARVNTGYRLGAIDLSDLLLARRQEHEARRMEITARADSIRSLLKLQIDAHVIWMGSEIEN